MTFHPSHLMAPSARTLLVPATLVAGLIWLRPAVAQTFTDVTPGVLALGGEISTGSAWADYDGDGDLDLYVCSASGADHLFRNDGGGVFVDVASGVMLDSIVTAAALWGDYDGDGDLDLFLARHGANALLRNDGGDTFVDVTAAPLGDTGPTYGGAWGDFDNDGDLDLYVVNDTGNEDSPNRLYRNDGGGTFVDATSGPLGGPSTDRGVACGDYDGDGDLDLLLTSHGTLLRNDGGNTFVDVSSGPVGTSLPNGAAFGDYDNDGDLDLYLSNGPPNEGLLLRNDGGDTFADATSGILDGGNLAHYGVSWVDFDNDGDLDLCITTGGPGSILARNDGGGTFVDVTPGSLAGAEDTNGEAWGDYDNDGDLDLYLTTSGANLLLRNDTPGGNHWLQVKLRGTVSNTPGIGARVRVVTGAVSQFREISACTGYLSQDARVASLGLGSAATVDSLVVLWPSGIVQVVDPPPAVDDSLTIVESAAPVIRTVSDIGGDQGGWVRVGFRSPGNDRAGIAAPIDTYYLWRRVDSPPVSAAVARDGVALADAAPAPAGFDLRRYRDHLYAIPAPVLSTQEALPPGTWEVVASAPGIGQESYLIATPTLADSTAAGGIFWSVYVVSAHSSALGAWFASAPDSGYSVDNIAPGVPTGFAASYGTGTVDLWWNPAPESDFQYFRVYRSSDPGFTPGPATLAQETASTSWEDSPTDPGSVYYKLTALDHAGNESAPAASGAVTGVGEGPVAAAMFALEAAAPNPFSAATRIGFDLPREATVRLQVFDVGGRLVRTLVQGSTPAGRHEVTWNGADDAGRRASPGVYLYRLRAGTFEATRRTVLLH